MFLKNSFVFFLLLFSGGIVFAQKKQDDYKPLWNKIDTLILKRGLNRSALAEVEKIYTMASRDQNQAQIIKALLYKKQLYQQMDENALQKSIREMEKEIAASKEPVTSILHSLLADSYWAYFQQSRWKLYDRSPAGPASDDPETWSAEDFHNRISALYLRSIAASDLLQKQSPDHFDPIIIKGNSRQLRPTLYDLLAHSALEYFQNDERLLNKPAYAFTMNEPAAYAPADLFINHEFKTRDTGSLYLRSLQIYQDLLRFHLNDKNPSALIDADLHRLAFVHRVSVLPEKDKLYENALNVLIAKYSDPYQQADARLALARHYIQKAARYEPYGDTIERFSYVKAKTLLDPLTGLNKEVANTAKNLLADILKPNLVLQLEEVNLPAKPFRMLVSYRNVDQVYFRIVKLGIVEKESFGTPGGKEDFWEKVLAKPALIQFQQKLPQTSDHQQHKTEIPVPGLPSGAYAIISSTSQNFNLNNEQSVSIAYFHVSNLAYLNNGDDFFVVHRETGQPISNATIQIWDKRYHSQTGKYRFVKGEKTNTDKNGFFKMDNSSIRNYNRLLEIIHQTDTLFTDNEIYSYSYRSPEDQEQLNREEYEKRNSRSFLFTDRAIYRPGQTVYFKGIAITRDFESREWKIIPDYKTTISLNDANYETIDSLVVTTNSFGSFNGQFVIPKGILNGNFELELNEPEGSVNFSVEEYKRPTFYIQFKNPEQTFRLNDTVITTAVANGYAGTSVSNAAVTYRVTREARFPYYWLFWKRGFPRSNPQEIAHGTTNTDQNGNFEIRFPALPDLSVSKELEPVFDYRITADVTDLNGETRTENYNVRIGYKSLNVEISLNQASSIPSDRFKSFGIRTENHSGDFIPAKIETSIYLLESPQRLIRNRLWDQPDQFVLNREEYLRLFPNDEYNDETNMQGWSRKEKVFSKTDSTHAGYSMNLDHRAFKPGWYLIEVSATDRFGEKTKSIEYWELRDPKSGRPAKPSYNWYEGIQVEAAPGDKMEIKVGSSAENLFVIRMEDRGSERDRDSKKPDQYRYQFLNLKTGFSSITKEILAGDVPGFAVRNVFVKNNRIFFSNTDVRVPLADKDLKINYETFRDKTLPGSSEKWKIKISGDQKDAMAAELLTAMYDSSLDQFRPHNWQIPAIYPGFYSGINWRSSNFDLAHSYERYTSATYYEEFVKTYDQIGIIAESGNGYSYHNRREKSLVSSKLEGRAAGIQVESQDSAVSFGVVEEADQSAPPPQDENAAPNDQNQIPGQAPVQIRTNMNETAFFMRELYTDSLGNVEISFTMPDAVTTWKWMVLAHTRNLAFGYSENSVVTRKQLMVQPNAPRFLR